ncbi:NAD(P)/FAD-dependent oxidoreductase [Tsukamurella soli]|uniref:FAD-dependent oxidoreductase n=1 Tax=Tsukamurella soli TaxID=644556 RepID=A0ABP8KCI1_9ACTN
MTHRIVILGAGYAGAFAAGHLARHLHPDDVAITVVNAEADFVERMRLHQLAAGHRLRRIPLAKFFAGTAIQLRVAGVLAVDADARTVVVADGDRIDRLEYDTLVYALGSAVADGTVPGAAEHACHVTSRPAALRLRQRLDELGDGDRVVVVGGNLTAIETVTEIAEARPTLRIALATSGEVGGWLGAEARAHMLRAFARLGIDVHELSAVHRVEQTGVVTADGTVLVSDVTVWAAGFATAPIAAASGLAVEPDGRVTVDRMMRSISHPEVYAAGDSVFVIGDNGRPLPMSCASAGFTSMQATATIIADLTGRDAPRKPLLYAGNHVSLGRGDALFQFVDGRGISKRWALRGRIAARLKAAILWGSVVSLGHPTFGLPTHRRHLTAAAGRPAAAPAA